MLVQPRIPQNVGAVGRTCAAGRAALHIVRPIPFELSDRSLKRSGMDYFDILDWRAHLGWEEAKADLAGRRLWFLTKHSRNNFYDQKFEPTDALIFGSEPAGLPEEVQCDTAGRDLRLPMPEQGARCLNLATAVAVSLYELLRQTGDLGKL